MPETAIYKGWKYTVRIRIEPDSRLSNYSIQFYRDHGLWFDEIRYDSHDEVHGRKMIAPHFHMKLGSPFKKDLTAAVEQIKSMIDNELSRIRGVIET